MTYAEIEEAYHRFVEVELNNPQPSQIDFIGINFHELDVPAIFKCYYSTKESLYDEEELLRPFEERHMIHALNLIRDTKYRDKIRYEIGLANRDNNNMTWLYRWVGNAFALSNRQKNELDAMTGWRCCSLDDYCYSALYYLGFITKRQTPFPLEAIKLHYILRTSKDPNKIGNNYFVDSEAVLRFLGSSGIPAFKTLAAALNPVADKENELWMAGIDYFAKPRGHAKYKIYLKDRGGSLLASLKALVTSLELFRLSEQLNAFSSWLDTKDSLELYGAALCLTEGEEWSINCYM